MSNQTTKTETVHNGDNGNGDDKGCPPGMKKDADGKCVSAETFKEQEGNAGDSTSKGTGTSEDPLPPPEPASVHDCPEGSTWVEGKGCTPSGDAAGGLGGGGVGAAETPGKESLEHYYKMIERLMAGHTEYNEKLLKQFAQMNDKQVEALASSLGNPMAKKESASFGVKMESSRVDDSGMKSIYDLTVTKPAAFFESAAKGTGDISQGFCSWTINPEAYFDTLKKGYINYSAPNVASGAIPAGTKLEAFTISGGDMPQIFSKQVYVVPGGRMRVPIRQFLDTQIITDADRYNWYTVDSFAFSGSQVEGTAETQEAQTITKVTATPALVRALQLVNYADIENAPFDLIEAFNRAAALGSIDAEATDVLDTVYNAITPTNWVNEAGVAITEDDVDDVGTALQEMVIQAARLIQEQGGDTAPGNLVMFIHPKPLAELILDVTTEFWAGNQGGQTSTLMTASMGVLENRFGMDIVPTNQVTTQNNTTNDAIRSVMIIKGSVGLAVAADLQIEAQRRPDLSALFVGARHRIKGAIIDETMTARMSTAD